MRIVLSVAVFMIIAMAVTGCGSSAPQQTPGGETVVNLPPWYTNLPADPNYLYQPFSAESKQMQLAVDKAVNGARVGIAQQMETKVQAMQKRFTEETGTGQDAQVLDMFTSATKSIVSNTLNGSKVKNQEIRTSNGLYTAYVLVEYPIGAANEALMKAITSQQQMYTRFRASEAYKELDEEVKKYEEFKKSQQQPN